MSSTISPSSLFWNAANALDGSDQQNPSKCEDGCCAGSYDENALQWLQIELMEYYLIQHIRILGSTDSKIVNYNDTLYLICRIIRNKRNTRGDARGAFKK